jgi:prepilin-type processing-associated H-X9-DG protein
MRRPAASSWEKNNSDNELSTRSARGEIDRQALMGMGATNVLDRMAASMGRLCGEVALSFAPCADVPFGGVLLALPALLVNGLLDHTKRHFKLPDGYYGMASVFMLLAFMALGRLRSIEALRYYAPGEWGKLLGLDRVPEVRTLREKVKTLAEQDPAGWSEALCRDWMEANPESAGYLYVDGHVRVYHGHQTKLPRHYVSRERLCMRATTDYWVNALDGQPFFVVSKAVDPGMLAVLRDEIVPRLERDVPNQPTLTDLMDEPRLHRFVLVFDREGYSPDFCGDMRKKRIACLMYNKFPGEDWPKEVFADKEVLLTHGTRVTMKLAERTVMFGDLEMREVRKLGQSGHQTSVLATDYVSDLTDIAGAMFSRWSQENFFGYMRQQFNLDRLIDYCVEAVPDTTPVVNPAYRHLDGEIRSTAAMLSKKLATFGAMTLTGDIEPDNVARFCERKAALEEEIRKHQSDLAELKAMRKNTPRHITFSELPKEEQFERLGQKSKHFIDTIKMIAYRAETAMANIVREKMSRPDEARSLLAALYRNTADLIPDEQNGTLTIRLHPLANKANDEAICYLCEEMTSAELVFPGTKLRLVFKSGSA